LYAKPLPKKTFGRAKTPTKQIAKKPFVKAKPPPKKKQVVKKKPFVKAKTPTKQNTKKKTPTKQVVKKKPFVRAKTPSKQVVKKKFVRAKTPSKQIAKGKKQIVKKKAFRGAKTPSKPLFPQGKVGPPLLLKVIVVGGTGIVTLAAALFISLSYVNPTSSIGDFSSKSTTTKVKKNQIGYRKTTKAPKEYIDLSDLSQK